MKARNAWNRTIAVVIVLILLSLQGAALAAIRVSKITMNTTSATITIFRNEKLGKTYQLKATISPSNASNKSLTWSSSNSSIARVDKNGKVTSVRTGRVTITAKARDGSGKKATCTIKIVKSSSYGVTGVKLNVSNATIYNTKDAKFLHNYQLRATIYPSNSTKKTVKWTSSNTGVATVSSSGYVTAVGVGSATITAAAQDGSGKKATCKVTVTLVPITLIYTQYIEPEADKIFNQLNYSLSSKSAAKTAYDTAKNALANLTTICKQYPALSTTALSYVNTMSTACSNALTRLEIISSSSDSTLESYQYTIMNTLKSFKEYVTSLP
jgi:uncharacterized protein YjdB